MTLHVDLTPDLESFVKGKVSSGRYGSADDLVRDALRRMQVEEGRLAAWQAAIRLGDVELDRGEGMAYTPQLLDEITASALKAMGSGQAVNPDVLP
jgi:antitoxin ParD1/3/4